MSRTERDAKLLGYAGLIPFAGGVVLAWAPGVPISFAADGVEWALLYAAVILSFMGGARWGIAMLAEERAVGGPFSGLLAAVTPALVGWLAVVPPGLVPAPFPTSARLALMMAAFAGLLALDLRGVRAGEAPDWYGGLRLRLTFGVLASLALIVIRLRS